MCNVRCAIHYKEITISEVGVLWWFHKMHHSSEYFNLSTGLRLPALQDVAQMLPELLQAFFIPPNIYIVHRALNLTYQFWLHTTAIPYLGPIEYFLCTPSSHRVHHGRNPYCIDRNYGTTLIIWDRIFGTYERERKDEEIVYGLVKPVNTFDQLYSQFSELKALTYDKGQLRNEKDEEVFPGVWNKVKKPLSCRRLTFHRNCEQSVSFLSRFALQFDLVRLIWMTRLLC
ncbi:fatty acid hydroxylase family protein [Cooperia oncophora]